MALWRDGGFADDIWTTLDDAAPIAGARRDRRLLRALAGGARRRCRRAPIRSASRSPPARTRSPQLAEAARRPLVALKFDKFADGRAFSYAELLRERHGFRGELRATGDVLLDEIALMQRCGFTSFEVTDANTLRALKEGRAAEGRACSTSRRRADAKRRPGRGRG